MAQVLYVGLITLVDDYGQFDGRPAVIHAECFSIWNELHPSDPQESAATRCALQELVAARLIDIWENTEGKPVVEVTQWQERVRYGAKRKWGIRRNPQESAGIRSEILPPSSPPPPSPTPSSPPSPCGGISDFDQLRSEMNVFWHRDEQAQWGYIEEHAAVEVSRRKEWRKEWHDIRAYLMKINPENKRFEPAAKSLEKLLNGWNAALDAARNGGVNAINRSNTAKSNPRLEGVCRPKTDYAAAAARKTGVPGQVAGTGHDTSKADGA